MVTARARKEADYYLSFDNFERDRVIESDYVEWFLYDSRGLPCRADNPILCAKAHYGIWVKELRERYNNPRRDDYIIWFEFMDQPVRFLCEVFGKDTTRRWAESLFRHMRWWYREGK